MPGSLYNSGIPSVSFFLTHVIFVIDIHEVRRQCLIFVVVMILDINSDARIESECSRKILGKGEAKCNYPVLFG